MEIAESLEVFPSTLPARRESAYAGWVSISVGCNNTCTFCIVPSLRGKEKDRRPGDVLAEVQALAADGVLEVTLLGQNVNSYGVEFGDRGAFAKLLRACGDVEGLERVRFTSPHPRDFTSDVIAAMAETPNVCPQLHMPLQSGSDDVLRRMRRSYRSARYLAIIDEVRAALPDAAITTDIIVGFPGETEADFAGHPGRGARRPGSRSAFTFQYSPRPGTPAATLPDQLPKAVVQERYERLVALQEEISWAAEPGARGPGGRGAGVHRGGAQGRRHPPAVRARPRRAAGALRPRLAGPRSGPATSWRCAVGYGAPHHLVADGPVLSPPAHPGRRRRTSPAPAPAAPPPGSACRASARPLRQPAAAAPACGAHGVADGGRRNARCPRSWQPSTASWSGVSRRVEHRIDPGPRRAGRVGRDARADRIADAAVDRVPCAGLGGARGHRRARACCRGCSPSPRSASGWWSPRSPWPRAGAALAWLAAVGCGFSVVTGVWAIWSRQVGVPAGGTGPGFGMVLAVLAVLVLAVCWVRIAMRR